MKKKVFLAILNEGYVRAELVQLILNWQLQTEFDIVISFPCDKPIEHNRNKIVQNFMKTDCEWLVQIDDDVVPTKDYLNLILYDKDIISGVCYAYRQDSIVPLVLKENPKDGLWKNIDCSQSEGLIECDSMGTGAIIIHRRVFENEKMLKHPFQSVWNEDGTRKKGLDLYFCEKAKKEGFEVWCHLGYKSSHIVQMDLMEVDRGFRARELKGGAIDDNFRLRRVDAETPPNKRKKFVRSKIEKKQNGSK